MAFTLAMHLSTSRETAPPFLANGARRAVMEAMVEDVSKSGRGDVGHSKLSASSGRNYLRDDPACGAVHIQPGTERGGRGKHVHA